MKRTSRSPSPLGHSRAFSTGNASGQSQASPQSASSANGRNPSRPLVVNGSGLRASVSAAGTPTASSDEAMTKEPAIDSVGSLSQTTHGSIPAAPIATEPSQIPQQPWVAEQLMPVTADFQQTWTMPPEQSASYSEEHRPVVVNGSHPNPGHTAPDDTSFRERVAMMSSQYLNPQYLTQDTTLAHPGYLPSGVRHSHASQQPQNAVIAPLDLAVSKDRVRKHAESDISLLSPVYETIAPHITTARKSDASGHSSKVSQGLESKSTAWSGALKHNLKSDEQVRAHHEANKPQQSKTPHTKQGPQNPKAANGSKENGHVRGAHSESDSGWQKAGKGKKKGPTVPQHGSAEPPPKNTSERKGG